MKGLEICGCFGRHLTKLNFAKGHTYLIVLDASLRNFLNFLKVTIRKITNKVLSDLLLPSVVC